MDSTARLGVSLLSAGQAQKELMVNEGFAVWDIAAFPAVEQGPLNDPPPSPVIGTCYIVGAEPTGTWSGHALNLAGFTSGGYRFIAPLEGMTVFVKADAQLARFRSGQWETGIVRGASLVLNGTQVVGSQSAAISSPVGGTTVDSEARAAVDQILVAMRTHGLIAS